MLLSSKISVPKRDVNISGSLREPILMLICEFTMVSNRTIVTFVARPLPKKATWRNTDGRTPAKNRTSVRSAVAPTPGGQNYNCTIDARIHTNDRSNARIVPRTSNVGTC